MQYKVIASHIPNEELLNYLAKDGWRLLQWTGDHFILEKNA